MQLAFQIVNVDFIAFVTIVYLLIFLRTNRTYDRTVLGRFVPSLVLLALLAISDNIDYYYSWKPEPHLIRKLAIMAGYIVRVFLLMASVFIIKNKSVSRRDRLFLFVPATLNALIILSALFTDRIFFLDGDNVLHREPLSFSPHALSLIYFFVVLGIAVRRHAQGDRAIIAMARTIQEALPAHSYLYRMGGDEFLALFCGTDMQAVQFVIEKIRSELKRQDCSCAIGLSAWDKGKDFQEIYNRADQRMYEDKQRMRELGLARMR